MCVCHMDYFLSGTSVEILIFVLARNPVEGGGEVLVAWPQRARRGVVCCAEMWSICTGT